MEQILNPRAPYADAEASALTGKSAASWPAIFAGAIVAASVSLILFALGSGLGLAAVSPWPGHGISATSFAVTTAIWFIVMQWISSCFGGYIAGRLRTRWIGTHTHEVFFRDTAHGFVTWALATLLVAAVFAISTLSAVGGATHAISGVASSAAQAAMPMSASAANAYGVDKLFRSASPSAASSRETAKAEAGHIVANAVATGNVPDADRAYLAAMVAAQSGVSAEEAQKRVDDLTANALALESKAKADADAARKAAAEAAIYTALSMLVGAFIASVSAALGGRLRDEHV
jgi:hypothetical protein